MSMNNPTDKHIVFSTNNQQYYCKSTLEFNTENGFWFVNDQGEL